LLRESAEVSPFVVADSEFLTEFHEILAEKDWRQQEIEKREKEIIEWAKTACADLPD
jgi:hypothetical protein